MGLADSVTHRSYFLDILCGGCGREPPRGRDQQSGTHDWAGRIGCCCSGLIYSTITDQALFQSFCLLTDGIKKYQCIESKLIEAFFKLWN